MINYQQHLQSKLNSLQIQHIKQDSTQRQSNTKFRSVKRGSNIYFKYGLLYEVERRFFHLNHSNNLKIDQVLANYFHHKHNPIYLVSQKLPIKIFVCGYCKQPFFSDITYLRHCIVCQCPINHQRSTIFFYFKGTQTKLTNADIKNTLSSKQLQELIKISDGKIHSILSEYEFKQNPKVNLNYYQCGSCNSRYRHLFDIQGFIIHCLQQCNVLNHQKSSHFIKIKYCQQKFSEFVQDISNFVLNYNILALSHEFYIKIQVNPQSEKDGFSLFCDNCSLTFPNPQDLLRHFLFQCGQTSISENSNQIKRKLKKITLAKNDKFYRKDCNKTQTRKFDKDQIQRVNQRMIKGCQEKINTTYKSIQTLLKNIYFCGQCLNHFESRDLYFAHCLAYACPLNHPYNSHHYFQSQTKRSFDIEKMRNYLFNQIRQVFSDKNLFISIKRSYMFKKIESLDTVINHEKPLICGKCKRELKYKYDYLTHILRTCACPKHPENSVAIQFRKVKLTDDQYLSHLMSLVYGFQLLSSTPQTKYQLISKQKYKQNCYVCGSCQTTFQNKYQFVYHCVLVCKSQKQQNSSHQIHQIVSEQIYDPFAIVEENCLSQEQDKQQSMQRNIHIEAKYTRRNRKKEIIYESQSQADSLDQHSQMEEKINKMYTPINKISSLIIEQDLSVQDEILEQNQPKHLIANIDFASNFNERFFCGKCKISFKRRQRLIKHFTQCKNFQNRQSSHFYITKNQQSKINDQIVLKWTHIKIPFEEKFPQYQVKKKDHYICGCGSKLSFNQVAIHNLSYHHGDVSEGSSHIILRYMLFNIPQKHFLYFPVEKRNQNSTDFFNCPCNPTIRLSYNDFVTHIIKRHAGKSPLFHMKILKNLTQTRQIQI